MWGRFDVEETGGASRALGCGLVSAALAVLAGCGSPEAPQTEEGDTYIEQRATEQLGQELRGSSHHDRHHHRDGFEPRVLRDHNPDPDVVEVFLHARVSKVDYGTGAKTAVWTYNGVVPGPTIEANVGDRLIVHFKNDLPEETTVHWHGVDVPATQDGSNLSQLGIAPGGTFTYEFKLLRAATYWYHPHIRTNEQVEKGLQGALIVRDKRKDRKLRLPRSEHLLVLDDVLLDDDGQVAAPFPMDPLENATTQVNGREGNVLLVNGRPGRTLKIKRGQPQRLRLVNTANARMMRISLSGTRMWRIGGDGGLLEEAISIDPIGMVHDGGGGHGDMGGDAGTGHMSGGMDMPMVSDPDLSKGLILTPGERADIVFTPLHKGEITLEWHDYARGRHQAAYMDDGSIGFSHAHHDGKAAPQVLATFEVVGGRHGHEYVPPSPLTSIPTLSANGAALLPVMFGHSMPNVDGDVTFFVQMKNGMPLPFDAVTAADAHTVTVGETRMWNVVNMTGGDHNFHPHGFTFQPVAYVFQDDAAATPEEQEIVVPFDYTEIKDTIRIPRRPGAMGSSRTILRALVRFDDAGREGQVAAAGKTPGNDSSGGWVFHCHILEHSKRGMMSFFQVVDTP